MCTLTVATREAGYLLAMNRDEQITRGVGLLPTIRESEGARAVSPSDGSGGTWIAANEHGIALGLLNWNDTGSRGLNAKTRSRGQVIPALIGSHSLQELHAVFEGLDLEGVLPFRLVGVFPSEREMHEWRWDSAQIKFLVHGWDMRHWFSSSLSDKQAESLRGAVCRTASNESDAGSTPWLRRLHASHAGGPGPFSLCVHREDVKTLSYTEVTCTPATVIVEHFLASPCTSRASHRVEIQRVAGVDSPSRGVGSHSMI